MKTILIVDDSSFMRSRVKMHLETAGYSVTEAGNGKVALEKVGQGNFACIVTDLLMPEMDGIALLENLKERNVETPVVVLTADIQQSTAQRCRELGARALLNKPPSAEPLLKCVEHAIEAREQEFASK